MCYFRSSVYFLCISFLLSSCIANKDLEYLQSSNQVNDVPNSNFTYKLQIGDVLSVQINTTTEQKHDFFNQEQTNNSQLMMHKPYLWGNLIKDDGKLELPSIGKIQAEGFTLRDLEREIKKIAVDYFDEPVVKVNIINFEVQVLGEVNKPGRYEIVRSNSDILLAIGKAGDLTEFANRKKIKVLRTNKEKHRIFYLDLTKKTVLNNPDFYLYPNDIIYIEPMPKRFYTFNNLPALVSMGMSALTLYLLIQQD